MVDYFFAQKIEVYTPAGVLVDSYYPDGEINDWERAEFTLGSRGGCLGGYLTLFGDIFETPTLADRAQIRIYGPDGEVCWRGFTLANEMEVEGERHRYTLRGYWQELDTVVMPDQLEIGAEVTADDDGSESGVVRVSGKGTVAAVVQYLADTYLAPQLGVTVSVAANTTPVAKLTVDGDQMNYVLEILEAMASGANYDADTGEGRELWVSLIDELGVFRFKEIDLTGTAVMTMQVGAAETSKQERGYVGRRQRAINRVGVIGRYSADLGRRMRVNVDGSWSKTAYGTSRRNLVGARMLTTAADARRVAAGYLAWWDEEVQGLDDGRQTLEVGEACPKPWDGPGVWATVNKGEVLRDYISVIRVDYGELFDVSMTLGVEPSDAESGALLPDAEDDPEGGGLPPGDDENPGPGAEVPVGASYLVPHDHGRRQSGGAAGFCKGSQ